MIIRNHPGLKHSAQEQQLHVIEYLRSWVVFDVSHCMVLDLPSVPSNILILSSLSPTATIFIVLSVPNPCCHHVVVLLVIESEFTRIRSYYTIMAPQNKMMLRKRL